MYEGGQNCQNVLQLLRDPKNFAPALKESLSGGGGGGGGGLRHIVFPSSTNFPNKFHYGVGVLSHEKKKGGGKKEKKKSWGGGGGQPVSRQLPTRTIPHHIGIGRN